MRFIDKSMKARIVPCLPKRTENRLTINDGKEDLSLKDLVGGNEVDVSIPNDVVGSFARDERALRRRSERIRISLRVGETEV